MKEYIPEGAEKYCIECSEDLEDCKEHEVVGMEYVRGIDGCIGIDSMPSFKWVWKCLNCGEEH